MKTSGVCPKCGSADIVIIPTTNSVKFLTGSIQVVRYMCGNCGYTEEWVPFEADIQKLKQKYQHLGKG